MNGIGVLEILSHQSASHLSEESGKNSEKAETCSNTYSNLCLTFFKSTGICLDPRYARDVGFEQKCSAQKKPRKMRSFFLAENVGFEPTVP